MPRTAQTTSAKIAISKPISAIADSESSPRESAIFSESSERFSRRRRSMISASPSRTAAYWLMVARIPVTAATPRAKYLAESDALSKTLNAARTMIAIRTSAGATWD